MRGLGNHPPVSASWTSRPSDTQAEETRPGFREPAWPSGKAHRLVSGRTQVRLSASALLSLPKNVVYGHCLVTLPCTVNETIKRLTTLVHLNQKCGNHSGGGSVARVR